MKYLIIGIIIVAVVIGVVIYSIPQVGPGTAYEFRVKQGCNIVDENIFFDNGIPDMNITEEIRDNVIIVHGYGASGLETVRFGQLCESTETFTLRVDCLESRKREVINFCMNIQVG